MLFVVKKGRCRETSLLVNARGLNHEGRGGGTKGTVVINETPRRSPAARGLWGAEAFPAKSSFSHEFDPREIGIDHGTSLE